MAFREKKKDGTTRLTGGHPALTIAMVINTMHPVGDLITTTRNGNPADWLGVGTWEIYAQGKALVGWSPVETEFDTVGETGGAKTVTLTATQLPDHEHQPGTLATATSGNHGHLYDRASGDGGSANRVTRGNTTATEDAGTQQNGAHTHNITGQTGPVSGTNNQPHNNLQPYIVVYVWRRTA